MARQVRVMMRARCRHPPCTESLKRKECNDPKLIHYNKVEKGGHFSAWEQPQLFSEEVRAGFRSLR